MAEKTLNVFEIAQLQVKHACDKLGTDPAVYEILKNPMTRPAARIRYTEYSWRRGFSWTARATAVIPRTAACMIVMTPSPFLTGQTDFLWFQTVQRCRAKSRTVPAPGPPGW